MDDLDKGVTLEGDDETQEETTPTSETESQEEGASDSSLKDGKTKTDRGTKVAKEPESKFYQTLKNENADMRRILQDPKALKEYVRQLEGTENPKEGDDDMADLATKVVDENGQVDLKKLMSFIDERTAKKIESGVKYLTENSLKRDKLQTSYNNDKDVVRNDHPELDPNNKDGYDKELEQFIGERFLAQGGLEGKVSLRQVVDQTYKFLEKREGVGRSKAETEIVRKSTGAISRNKVQGDAKENEEDMDASQILASRVRKAVGGR